MAGKPPQRPSIQKEQHGKLSQSYLSQIESGARPHLTNSSRMLLAKFFKVHPGYLVDDPEGYHTELLSDIRAQEDKLDLWLISGAEQFRRDPEVHHALLALARHEDSRRCLVLMREILETPGLAERLLEVLRPGRAHPSKSSQGGAPTLTTDSRRGILPRHGPTRICSSHCHDGCFGGSAEVDERARRASER